MLAARLRARTLGSGVTVVRIGTRASALALWQTHHIAARLTALTPGLRVEIVEIVSTGDRIIDLPLTEVEGTGFFTATLEGALLEGRVDVAVHSHKDLPVAQTGGLVVAAVPQRGPVEDALCARDGFTLATLPRGATVGTCSTRREAQVRALRPDLEVRPLRGNVPTRVGRVTGGELDAIVLARAGLERLDLQTHITERFAVDVMLPAPAQGALAVQCRAGDTELRHRLEALDHADTRRAVTAERGLLHALGGGCSVPVGATATCDGPRLTLAAGVFALDTPRALRIAGSGTDPVQLGYALARGLLDLGAGEILAAVDKSPRLDSPAASGARS